MNISAQNLKLHQKGNDTTLQQITSLQDLISQPISTDKIHIDKW